MVLEQEILPYLEWLLHGFGGALGALPRFLLVALAVALLGLLFGSLISVLRRGVLRGGDHVYSTITQAFRELWEVSFRRIWAIASLAMKESWRRRVVVALVVYFIILLFASWFLKTDYQQPAKLYLSFVLIATTYLVLAVALLLSAFSLPNDFKTKTIYTVVTKPIRAGEIIVGRILGFTLVGTVLLAVMGCCSYIFIVRSLDHTHTIDGSNLKRITDASGEFAGYEGITSTDAYHRHTVLLKPDRSGSTSLDADHFHEVDPEGDRLQVSSPLDYLQARIPLWGKLRFLDRRGVDKPRGINVGNEWSYRSFIDGDSLATAIWTFDGVDESVDDHLDEEGILLGLITRVFRTHKGIIGEAIPGTIRLRNPETGLLSDTVTFSAKDAQVDEVFISRNALSEGEEIDLFDDLVSSDGQLEVQIQCMARGQYFGYAQADCYICMPDGSPLWNYVKSYISIWMQMVVVIAIGITASTLLSGPVAMLLSVSFMLLGFFRDFFVGIAAGSDFARYGVEKVYGGGPVEALYRIITQKNIISPLDPGPSTSLIEGIDAVLRFFMMGVAYVLPDFSSFSTTNFSAYGYDIPGVLVAENLTVCLGYVAGLAVLGYFLLRTREVAR